MVSVFLTTMTASGADPGFDGETRPHIPTHVEAVLQILGWDMEEIETLVVACHIRSNIHFHFLLILPGDLFNAELAKCTDCPPILRHQMKYLRAHYLACQHCSSWVQDFTLDDFLTFVLHCPQKIPFDTTSGNSTGASAVADEDADTACSAPTGDGTLDDACDCILPSTDVVQDNTAPSTVPSWKHHGRVTTHDHGRPIWHELPDKPSSVTAADLIKWFDCFYDEALDVDISFGTANHYPKAWLPVYADPRFHHSILTSDFPSAGHME